MFNNGLLQLEKTPHSLSFSKSKTEKMGCISNLSSSQNMRMDKPLNDSITSSAHRPSITALNPRYWSIRGDRGDRGAWRRVIENVEIGWFIDSVFIIFHHNNSFKMYDELSLFSYSLDWRDNTSGLIYLLSNYASLSNLCSMYLHHGLLVD